MGKHGIVFVDRWSFILRFNYIELSPTMNYIHGVGFSNKRVYVD